MIEADPSCHAALSAAQTSYAATTASAATQYDTDLAAADAALNGAITGGQSAYETLLTIADIALKVSLQAANTTYAAATAAQTSLDSAPIQAESQYQSAQNAATNLRQSLADVAQTQYDQSVAGARTTYNGEMAAAAISRQNAIAAAATTRDNGRQTADIGRPESFGRRQHASYCLRLREFIGQQLLVDGSDLRWDLAVGSSWFDGNADYITTFQNVYNYGPLGQTQNSSGAYYYGTRGAPAISTIATALATGTLIWDAAGLPTYTIATSQGHFVYGVTQAGETTWYHWFGGTELISGGSAEYFASHATFWTT